MTPVTSCCIACSVIEPALRCVVFAIGNPSRGDDALGPLLLQRLAQFDAAHRLTLVEDFQLQIEHSLDLLDHDVALFIDAAVPPAVDAEQTFSLLPLQSSSQLRGMSHALTPQELLKIAHDHGTMAPPPAWLLSVRGEHFELGEPLSALASRHLELAWSALQAWLAERGVLG